MVGRGQPDTKRAGQRAEVLARLQLCRKEMVCPADRGGAVHWWSRELRSRSRAVLQKLGLFHGPGNRGGGREQLPSNFEAEGRRPLNFDEKMHCKNI